jgi:hypothetical protein
MISFVGTDDSREGFVTRTPALLLCNGYSKRCARLWNPGPSRHPGSRVRTLHQAECAISKPEQRGDRARGSGSHLGVWPSFGTFGPETPFLKTESQPTLPLIRHIRRSLLGRPEAFSSALHVIARTQWSPLLPLKGDRKTLFLVDHCVIGGKFGIETDRDPRG